MSSIGKTKNSIVYTSVPREVVERRKKCLRTKKEKLFTTSETSSGSATEPGLVPALTMTPAILPTDGTTLLCGYVVEGRSDLMGVLSDRQLREMCEMESETLLSTAGTYKLTSVGHCRGRVVIPVERADDPHDARPPKAVSRGPCAPRDVPENRRKKERKSSANNERVLYMSGGKTVETEKQPKCNEETKASDATFTGALPLKLSELNKTLKFNFDRDFQEMFNLLAKEKSSCKLFLKLCA